MVLHNSEGANPEVKLRNEYFENITKFHIFVEHNDKTKLNAKIN